MGARVGRLATALGAALCALLLASAPATAQDPSDTGWVIERFEVRLSVGDDGTLVVEERIEVDFGALDKHGIYRVIPVRYELPEDPSRYRVLDVEGIEVTGTAPSDVQVQRPSRVGSDRDLVLRIGDPDTTVSGRQSYTIRYQVQGALNAFDSHDELYWNVTGNGWPVPIREARAALRGGQLVRLACYRGPAGAANLCDDSGILPGAYPAWAVATDLARGEGLTVVGGFAKGTIAVGEPRYEERWTLARAFTGSAAAWPLASATALLAVVGVSMLLWRSGRDRAALGGATAAGVVATGERPRPLGDVTVVPEFRPPDDLRPAQLGLLVDERVDSVDVSATIVDLAVRGYLVIEERESPRLLWFSRTDWALKRTDKEPDGLLAWERRLLDALFATGEEVSLEDLKGTFAEEYRAVCADIEREAVTRSWFRGRPSHTRIGWLLGGLALTALAVGLTVLLALFTTFALAGVPLVLGGLALAFAHRWMPARTSQGSRLFARTLGFREYIRRAEVGRMEFAEAQRLFVAYLPYAVAFGAVEHWARTFATLGVTSATVGGWYTGSHIASAGGLDRMSAGLSDFSRAVGGSLPTTPASSGSSGFGGGGSSGGGFGGGGGGSW